VKQAVLIITLLSFSPAFAKEKPADHGLLVVYNPVSAETAALDRQARQAYAGKFRIVDVTERDGFTRGRMKGIPDMFGGDPRSKRERKAPGKIVFLFVVTADGRVIEPRIIQSSDRGVANYLINWTLVRRFVPARYRGVPVAAVHSVELDLGIEEPMRNPPANDGLGIMGYRDR
jgi:hypothetical protein